MGLGSGLWSEVLRATLLAAARARGELGRSVVERHLARLNSRQERVSFTIVIVPQQDVRDVHKARRGARHHQTMPPRAARSSDLRSRRRQHEGGREQGDEAEKHGTKQRAVLADLITACTRRLRVTECARGTKTKRRTATPLIAHTLTHTFYLSPHSTGWGRAPRCCCALSERTRPTVRPAAQHATGHPQCARADGAAWAAK